VSGHVFLRHPPLPQMRGRCYGRLDVALPSEVFASAAASLRADAPDHALWSLPVISSPAQRCHGLAQACANGRNIATDARLLEMDFGDWENQVWSDVPREALDRWACDVAGFRPPGGESFADLIARVGAALDALSGPHLIVAHAGVVRAATHLLGAVPRAEAATIEVPYLQPIGFRPADEWSRMLRPAPVVGAAPT
jgi:alpha-ribazole phosphatase